MHTLAIDSGSHLAATQSPGVARERMRNRSAAKILEDVYDLHSESVFCWIRGMLGSREAAEDGVQCVWLNLARNPDRLSSISNPRAYVWSATRNHVNSVLRRRALERLWLQPLTYEESDLISVQDSGAAITEDERRDLVRLVQNLSSRLRAVVLLVSFAGFTLEEAAESLGIPRGTAASRYHAAIQKLKLTLASGD